MAIGNNDFNVTDDNESQSGGSTGSQDGEEQNTWGDPLDWQESQEPPDVEVEVDDKEYRNQSIPDEAGGYFVGDKITSADDFDEEMLTSFKGVAHSEKVNQGTFESIVKWHNKNVSKLRSGDVVGYKDSFMDFADRRGLSERQVQALTGWFDGRQKSEKKKLAQLKKFSRQSHGRGGSDALAAAKAAIVKSKAYLNKGNTAAERKAHDKAVKDLFALCSRGGR